VLHVVFADRARDWPAAHAALDDGGVAVLDDGPVAPSLEDVFIAMVHEREAAGA
jgi:hypothetical protein